METPLALYRRYRPESFVEVIGQEHVTDPLRAALANNRVHHAYLFSGPRGCGKTTSARILARALNCEAAPVSDPCGHCQSCRYLARGGPGSIDVIEIDAASHNGVDDARDLRERAFFAPVSSRYKVYIIDEAHMVTPQAFNALLKLVEEPPPHLKFVFATTEPEKVIGTIRSRTHHYPFRLIPPRALSAYLTGLCEKEGVHIEPAALPLVVRAGGGSARDTLSVLDQLIGGAAEDGVTYRLATGLLGYTPDSLLDEVVDAFAAGDGATVFGVVDKVIETGQDPRRFTEDLLRRLRDLVILAVVPDAPATGLIDVPADQGERMAAQSARFGQSELSRAADLVAAGLADLKGATAPRLLLELICARVLLPGADDTRNGLMARLDRLERRLSIEGPTSSRPQSGPQLLVQPGPPDAAYVGPPPVSHTNPQSPVVEEPDTYRAGVEPMAQTGQGPAPTDQAMAARQPGPPAQVQQAETQNAPTGALSLVEVRRLWPHLLESVKARRRYTWILLSQNGQVVGVDDETLTIALTSAGARNSFLNGGSDEILRQAAIDLIGHDWRVEAIVDSSARPGSPPGGDPEPDPGQSPNPGAARGADVQVTRTAVREPLAGPDEAGRPHVEATAPGSGHIASARGAIRPTRAAGVPAVRAHADADQHADPDDPAADGPRVGGAELLERELGARVIEEIRHD